jgi:general secretion pathway protein G
MFPISKHSGFNLIDFLINLLIALAILGFLIVLIGPSFVCKIERDDSNPTLTQLAQIELALDIYRLDMLEYPKTLEGLIKNETTDPRWRGPYLKNGIIPHDPWNNPFQYQILGLEGKEYYLYSYGADGKLGGEGEAADIRNWAGKNGD